MFLALDCCEIHKSFKIAFWQLACTNVVWVVICWSIVNRFDIINSLFTKDFATIKLWKDALWWQNSVRTNSKVCEWLIGLLLYHRFCLWLFIHIRLTFVKIDLTCCFIFWGLSWRGSSNQFAKSFNLRPYHFPLLIFPV